MKRKGFTLMELIATMAILSILALIIIPNFLQYIPEAGTVQCQSNKEAILLKYEYAIQRDNRKMHDNLYGDNEQGYQRLEAIQTSVLEEMTKQVHCSKDGVYSIEDESTINISLIRVQCSKHDDDAISEESKMYNEIVNGIYKSIDACLANEEEADIKACLKNAYGADAFDYVRDKPWIAANLYKDENIIPIIKKFFGGEYPLLNKDLFDTSVNISTKPNDVLYIRPKVLQSNQKDVILFASTSEVGWAAKAVYIEGKWYKSSTYTTSYNGTKILKDITIASQNLSVDYFKQQINIGELIPINKPYPSDS